MESFAPLSASVRAQLARAAGGRLLEGAALSADYARDETPGLGEFPPAAVAVPHSAEEVAALLRLCQAHRVCVTVRGAGTGLAGGAVPVRGGLVLSLAEMDRILAFDEDNLSVRVQPGVPLGVLQGECARRGLFYPPDPGEKDATLGGNVSTNAGGMRAVKYGVTRDYVRALTAVLPTGETVRLGADVAKSSSGYDLLRLMIGAEGTLGVITELTLRLLPLPRERVDLIAPFAGPEACLAAVPPLLRAGPLPCTLEFLERGIARSCEAYTGQSVFPAGAEEPGAYLLLSYDGDDWDALMRTAGSAGETLLAAGAADVLAVDTPGAQKNLRAAREVFLDAIRADSDVREEVDAVVPLPRMGELLAWAKAQGAALGLTVRAFGHAGDGNLHLYACGGTPEAARELSRSVRARARELGGLPSGEHGIGLVNREALAEAAGPAAMALMAGVKRVFDPGGILNPDKIFPAGGL